MARRAPWCDIMAAVRRQLLVSISLCTACVQRAEIGAFDGDGGDGGSTIADLDLERFTTPIATSALSTCATTSSNGLACWGNNGDGELGINDTELPFSLSGPVTPLGLETGAHAIFGGGDGYCVLRDTGKVECWGKTYYASFAGTAVYGSSYAPTEQPFLGEETVQVAIGGEWLCSLTQAGKAKCWGVGASGQLGNGSTDDALEPHDVANVSGERYVQLAAAISGAHTCGATGDGGVLCWGHNESGQLGTSGPDRLLPAPVPIEGVLDIAAGYAHTCVRKSDSTVWCWGEGVYGQLGGAPTSSDAVMIGGLPPATSIAAGGAQTCVRTLEAAVWCWGSVAGSITQPIEVLPASFGAAAVACGAGHACAINEAHVVRCWGSDMFGQIAGGEVAL